MGGQAHTQLAGRSALAEPSENGSGGCMELWPGPPHLARKRDCTTNGMSLWSIVVQNSLEMRAGTTAIVSRL